ncbi:glycosyltransferase [Nocardioides agariphilus]|uniref:Glycosyltransferase n=1 Tax=Nocardioides agariphilus TaxID=433664 RepID=A0A930VQ46_9ACTN|nr:glycosyltransferase [Nocardioides agariphilus]MBF4768845.1 glycosyltransferase [Nocardioides agariphilus]
MSSVLWYSNETPDIGGQGGQRRQYFQIRSLVEAGHDVTVVTLDGEQDDSSISAIAPTRRLPRPGRWAHWAGRLPGQWTGRAVGGRSARAAAVLDVPADCTVIAHIESWLHLTGRGLRPVGPRLLDLHNVFSAWYAAQGQAASAEQWRQHEIAVLRELDARRDAVSVCSAREHDALMRSTGSDSVVVPHGIEPGEWQAEPQPAERPVMKLFGNWDWEPNHNGLRWFLDEVVPLVSSTDVRVEVAGRGTQGLAETDGVHFVGRVGDLSMFLSDAWLVAMPVKVGVGAPVKFAEGVVTGVPLLATGDAADGSTSPGLLVSDDPTQWAGRIAEVLREPDGFFAASRRRRSEALVERAWDATTEPLRRWVERSQASGR